MMTIQKTILAISFILLSILVLSYLFNPSVNSALSGSDNILWLLRPLITAALLLTILFAVLRNKWEKADQI